MAWTIADEGTHPVPTSSEKWQESVVLYWRDARNGIGGAHRIGYEPNWAGTGRVGLWSGVFTSDGTVFRTNLDDLPLVPIDGIGFRAGAHACFHDGTSLRYTADEDELSMHLEVTDVPGTFVDLERGEADYNAPDGTSEATFFSHHMESHCLVRGTVEIDRRTIQVDGLAWRDHSWGIRHWEEIWGSRFFAGGDGTAGTSYTFLAVVPPSGQLRRMGTLTLDGSPQKVVDVSMRIRLEDDWMSVPGAELTYVLDDGSTRTLDYTALGGHLAHTRVVSWESVGDVSLDGEPLGWALLEAVANHRGSPNPPAFALNNAMTNGLTKTAKGSR